MHNNGAVKVRYGPFLSLTCVGMNSILGDEMGLGKTLQVLQFLRFQYAATHDGLYYRRYLSLPT
jgi:SNF2 family DNA or RNA helicase